MANEETTTREAETWSAPRDEKENQIEPSTEMKQEP